MWIQEEHCLNESIAILRFVGRQYGYYPPDAHEMWRTDAIVDYANDFIPKLIQITYKEQRLDESG